MIQINNIGLPLAATPSGARTRMATPGHPAAIGPDNPIGFSLARSRIAAGGARLADLFGDFTGCEITA